MAESLEPRLQLLLGSQYRLGRELSGGGMSRLFVAHEPALKRDVVVKVLPPDLVTTTSLLRFQREIEVTAQLQHPHILPIITAGGEGELLYYITPFIQGESLKDRLSKGGPLPFDESLRLASELLGAIAFAHGRGVIHRDVKPGNVLLAEGHAILADFGIARALAGPDDGHVTQSGTVVGTPAYLAPELPIDEARDLYAVAVVLYEMIAGDVPRGARTADRITSAVAANAPRTAAARARRLGRVLGRALSPDLSQRYSSARELQDAFDRASRDSIVSRRLIVAAAIAVIALGSAAAWIGARSSPSTVLTPEGTMIAVMPFTAVGSDSIPAIGDTIAVRVSEALQQWSGLGLVAPSRVREELGGARALTNAKAMRAARAAGADRVVIGSIARTGASLQATASILDATRGLTIRSRVATLGGTPAAQFQQARVLANGLLRDSTELPWRDASDRRRVSLAGWIAFDSAETAMHQWRLADAIRLLGVAVAQDPENIRAQLVLAEALRWSRESNVPAGTIEKSAAARADEGHGRLASYDALLARGANALSVGDFPGACAAFSAATAARAGEFEGWMGLGECQLADTLVVPWAQSPTKYRFRSSYWSAAKSYERALATLSGPRPAFAHGRLARALVTEPNHLRLGHSADGRIFAAQVERFGDTTGYRPLDVAANHGVGPSAAASTSAALQVARDELRPTLIAWATSDSASSDAHYSLARLLETAGNIATASGDGYTALGEIRRARALTRDSTMMADLMRSQIRLFVKAAHWGDARRLADSALAMWPKPNDGIAERLIGPAALVGRTERVSALLQQMSATPSRALRDRAGRPLNLPPAILMARADFVARAATGACDDAVRRAPARLTGLENAFYGAAARPLGLDDILTAEPVMLSLPCLGASAAAALDASRSQVIGAARGLGTHDTTARSMLRALAASRESAPGETLSMDFVLEQAWLSAAVGDTAQARHILERALTAVPAMFEAVINRESIAGAIPRAMRLCGALAAAQHDPAGLKWAAAADSLRSRER